MVKLEEVDDEAFARDQAGPTGGEEDWEDESGIAFSTALKSARKYANSRHKDASDASSIASSTLADETLIDRITALKDIVPPAQRRYLSKTINSSYGWVRSGFSFGGKALWVISTSALLLGVPWALAYAEEQQMVEMEREMKMQQSANDASVSQ